MPVQVLTTQLAVRQLPHRSFSRAQFVLFAGRRGKGKTVALSAYLESCEPRVLAIDAFNDLLGIRRRLEINDALDDLEANPVACRRRLVPPITIDLENPRGTLSTIAYARLVMAELVRRRIRNVLLVLDELTLWTTPQGDNIIQLLALQGRRLNIRIAAAIQRLALTPGVLQSEVTELVCFQQTRPRDLEVLADWTDDETAETVRKLQVGECVVVMP